MLEQTKPSLSAVSERCMVAAALLLQQSLLHDDLPNKGFPPWQNRPDRRRGIAYAAV
jgi:hypothetical protein